MSMKICTYRLILDWGSDFGRPIGYRLPGHTSDVGTHALFYFDRLCAYEHKAVDQGLRHSRRERLSEARFVYRIMGKDERLPAIDFRAAFNYDIHSATESRSKCRWASRGFGRGGA